MALEQAVALHRAGRIPEAERLYRSILETHPNHADAHHNLGVLIAGGGAAQAALPHFKAALEANPNHSQYWLSYIGGLLSAYRPQDAHTLLDEGRKVGLAGPAADQLRAQILSVLAERNCQAGHFTYAESLADELLMLTPQNADPHHLMGRILYGAARETHGASYRPQLEKAAAIHRKALELTPEHAGAIKDLAVVERALLFLQQLQDIFADYDALSGGEPRAESANLAVAMTRKLSTVGDYYDHTLASHGETFAGVSAHDKDYHEALVNRLADYVASVPNVRSIADIGCGYGILVGLLEQRAGGAARLYVGYDVSPQMVEAARARDRSGRAEFSVSAIPLRSADYSVAIGTFNLSLGHSPAQWERYVLSMILRMAKTSRVGFSFTLLNQGFSTARELIPLDMA